MQRILDFGLRILDCRMREDTGDFVEKDWMLDTGCLILNTFQRLSVQICVLTLGEGFEVCRKG